MQVYAIIFLISLAEIVLLQFAFMGRIMLPCFFLAQCASLQFLIGGIRIVAIPSFIGMQFVEIIHICHESNFKKFEIP